MSGCRYVGLIIITVLQMAICMVITGTSGWLRNFVSQDAQMCLDLGYTLDSALCNQGWWPYAVNLGLAVGAVASFAGLVSLVLICAMKRSSIAAMSTALNILATIMCAVGGGFMTYVLTQHPTFDANDDTYRFWRTPFGQVKLAILIDIAAMFVGLLVVPITIAAISSVRRAAERKEYDYERVFIPKH